MKKLIKIHKDCAEFMTIVGEAFKALQRVTQNTTTRCAVPDDIEAFALHWCIAECKAENFPFESAPQNPDAAKQFIIRFLEWKLARAKFWEVLAIKECPEQKIEGTDVGKGAVAGLLIAKDEAKGDSRVLDFLESHTPGAYDVFKKWCEKPKPERWQYPLLDSWLLCIWPIVTKHGWTYRNVWQVAVEKFESPEHGRGTSSPFETAKRMRAHCIELGLKTKGTRPGRIKADDESTLPPFADLALKIPAEFPKNSLFPILDR